MGKKIEFRDTDKDLIEAIKSYQEENHIKHFVEAVRQLCRSGLDQNVQIKIELNKSKQLGK